MKFLLSTFILPLFFFTSCLEKPLVLPEKPSRTEIEKADGKIVSVSGRLRLVGDNQLNGFVITPVNQEFDINIKVKDKDQAKLLLALQEYPVKGTGKLKVELFSYPNPKYNHKEYFIELESIEKTGSAGY